LFTLKFETAIIISLTCAFRKHTSGNFFVVVVVVLRKLQKLLVDKWLWWLTYPRRPRTPVGIFRHSNVPSETTHRSASVLNTHTHTHIYMQRQTFIRALFKLFNTCIYVLGDKLIQTHSASWKERFDSLFFPIVMYIQQLKRFLEWEKKNVGRVWFRLSGIDWIVGSWAFLTVNGSRNAAFCRNIRILSYDFMVTLKYLQTGKQW